MSEPEAVGEPEATIAGVVRRPAVGAALDQVVRQEFSVAEAIGGPRGFVEAVVPSVVFLVWFQLTHGLLEASLAAVAAAGLAVLARAVSRSSPLQAVSGLLGVALCAAVAAVTGSARNYFLPGLLQNVGFLVLYAGSTFRFPSLTVPYSGQRLPAGRWPLIGLLVGPLTGEGMAWRDDPARARAYWQVTWLWAAMFALRLAVQVPVYLGGSVGVLGVTKLAMGVPLFALVAFVTWLVLHQVPPASPSAALAGQEPGTP